MSVHHGVLFKYLTLLCFCNGDSWLTGNKVIKTLDAVLSTDL